ncbi:MAG: ankyrin repeat domain-containing protein [Puniceicoccales bacterium]|jgi:hypothetical protein|nr:ankyrin repeat domain-containing protein [Puniceicoccales bacterium]
MKTYNRKTVRNIVFTGCLLVGTFGETELLYGGPWNPAHQAVEHNDVTKIEDLIATGEIIRYLAEKDDYDRTPLRLAVDRGNIPILLRLLQIGDDVDTRDNQWKTPLMAAIGDGNPEIIEILLDAGADVDARDVNRRTVLMMAVATGNPWIINRIIQAGEKVNPPQYKPYDYLLNGDNPLGVAITNIDLDAVKILLEAGARVDNDPSHNREAYSRTIIQRRFDRSGKREITQKQSRTIQEIFRLLIKSYNEQHAPILRPVMHTLRRS